MEHSPLSQFIIKPIVKLDLFGVDISFTNSSLMMVIATISILALFSFVSESNRGVPSKMHMISESMYSLVVNLLNENVGEKGKQFVPFVFCLFLFILFTNLIGQAPYSYAVTSQIAVTFFMAMLVFFATVIVGFIKKGTHFFEIFLPKGIPILLAPLIILIELFAFSARPITLSLRLAANMIAGHILLKVLAGFAVMLPFYAKILPLPFIIATIGLELFVAVLQAYVFIILSCVYLSDAVNGH